MLFPTSPSKCHATCGIVRTAFFDKIATDRIFALTTNICIVTPQTQELTIDANEFEFPDKDACQTSQCSCTVRITRTGIRLTKPAAMNKVKVSEENPYGSSASPVNCNASGFAPWLAIKLTGPQASVLPIELPVAPEVTISDVVLDSVCSAFINRLPPEAASDGGASALFIEAKQDLAAAGKRRTDQKTRAAKTSTTHPDLARKSKRPKMAHSCSRPSPCVQTLYQHLQVCPTPEVVDERNVPSPAANEVAPMAQNRPRPNQALEERQSWDNLLGFTAGELDNFDNLDKFDDVNAFVGFFDDDADS